MSKVKSPTQKKALSLKRDRRNVYGENPAASRKGIRRRKQLSHSAERHAISSTLGRVRQDSSEENASEVDAIERQLRAERKIKAFKKMPDRPLGEVILKKQLRRTARAERGKRKKQAIALGRFRTS